MMTIASAITAILAAISPTLYTVGHDHSGWPLGAVMGVWVAILGLLAATATVALTPSRLADKFAITAYILIGVGIAVAVVSMALL